LALTMLTGCAKDQMATALVRADQSTHWSRKAPDPAWTLAGFREMSDFRSGHSRGRALPSETATALNRMSDFPTGHATTLVSATAHPILPRQSAVFAQGTADRQKDLRTNSRRRALRSRPQRRRLPTPANLKAGPIAPMSSRCTLPSAPREWTEASVPPGRPSLQTGIDLMNQPRP
jgi:hypothetical protein